MKVVGSSKNVTITAVHNPPSSQNDFGGQAGSAGFRQKADQPLAEAPNR